ncbi:hypothetical protein HBH92_177900 [Parastagonospora nodorum]|nr:hypothetical protein HBH92_177900 [Parastagonospora nodorum]KAH4434266.1 hypothetical protein HBH93_124890 [Parastagonospora nodorum]KAH4446585.1 hypothetical protein HBH91_142770 [Parastagonospora nodorum]KAH4504034.1 hypothetical protein HBH89_098310 [Parastagonospora nodorum]KAH4538518.1 hypothetical protein HBH85_142020 [Parastagonospora nodorum]
MARAEAHKFKGKEEHLIFVKNVPAYMAHRSIPDLYKQYEPVRFKNVYPHSDITTVVIGFRTHDEAVYAQQQTDGVRLESVVLRVEKYNKHRSVRYLQEVRTKGQPLGPTYDDFEEEEEEDQEPEPEYVLPFGPTTEETAGVQKTWARIAGNDRATNGMMPLPPPATAFRVRHPTSVNSTAKSTPTFAVAVPYIAALHKTDEAASEVTTIDSVPVQSPGTQFVGVASSKGVVEEKKKTKTRPDATKVAMPIRTSIFTDWEPIDSTQRFAQLHCRDCSFCKMRERSKVEKKDQYSHPEKLL